MENYVCSVCGYVYDPAIGDSEGGIIINTNFDKIPSGWICPLCGAPKAEFEKTK